MSNKYIDMTPPQPLIIPRGIMEHKDFETYFWKWYGFVIPDQNALQLIKKYTYGKTILEIGAGTGLWAKLLQNNNVDIIATDLMAPIYKNNWYRRFWADVEEIDAIDAIKKYQDKDVLMLIWPHNDNVWAEALKEFTGNTFIYAGKSGPEELHEQIEKNWEITIKEDLNLFPTNNHQDIKIGQPTLYIMKRKDKK